MPGVVMVVYVVQVQYVKSPLQSLVGFQWVRRKRRPWKTITSDVRPGLRFRTKTKIPENEKSLVFVFVVPKRSPFKIETRTNNNYKVNTHKQQQRLGHPDKIFRFPSPD